MSGEITSEGNQLYFLARIEGPDGIYTPSLVGTQNHITELMHRMAVEILLKWNPCLPALAWLNPNQSKDTLETGATHDTSIEVIDDCINSMNLNNEAWAYHSWGWMLDHAGRWETIWAMC